MSNFEKLVWQLKDGLVFFKNKLYVLPGILHREAVRLYHDNLLAGHFGYLQTLELVSRKYFWPGINKDIKKYVDTCDTCHCIKPIRYKPYRSLNPLLAPRAPFTDLIMDFITDMPPCEFHETIYNSIFLVMC